MHRSLLTITRLLLYDRVQGIILSLNLSSNVLTYIIQMGKPSDKRMVEGKIGTVGMSIPDPTSARMFN